jgi:hypothetical protein
VLIACVCFDCSLQRFKQHVAGAVVSTGNASVSTMSVSSLARLFRPVESAAGASAGAGVGADAGAGAGGGVCVGVGAGGGGSGSGTFIAVDGEEGGAAGLTGAAASVVASLGDLWSEEQYNDLDASTFLQRIAVEVQATLAATTSAHSSRGIADVV